MKEESFKDVTLFDNLSEDEKLLFLENDLSILKQNINEISNNFNEIIKKIRNNLSKEEFNRFLKMMFSDVLILRYNSSVIKDNLQTSNIYNMDLFTEDEKKLYNSFIEKLVEENHE